MPIMSTPAVRAIIYLPNGGHIGVQIRRPTLPHLPLPITEGKRLKSLNLLPLCHIALGTTEARGKFGKVNRDYFSGPRSITPIQHFAETQKAIAK